MINHSINHTVMAVFWSQMSTVSLPALSRVAVCGGTHGDELSGVYLVREHLRRRQQSERRESSYALKMVMSNPRAVQQCRRYTEIDLNRCFTQASLDAPICDRTPYEIVRSQELNALLGPKGSAAATDLVDFHKWVSFIELHFMNDSCGYCKNLSHFLCCPQRELATIPVRYIHFDKPKNEAYSLDTVGKHGFAMEIGPQPHGSVRSNIFAAMQEGVELMLEWIQLFNSGNEKLQFPPFHAFTGRPANGGGGGGMVNGSLAPSPGRAQNWSTIQPRLSSGPELRCKMKIGTLKHHTELVCALRSKIDLACCIQSLTIFFRLSQKANNGSGRCPQTKHDDYAIFKPLKQLEETPHSIGSAQLLTLKTRH
ncbi:hypothetical protein ACEWY4_024861 [Coilia grayii]|uniref:Succinylglutamate desuccinylase/Aspartoacylase catalytic domain-containing protein n=1 Tax=Coilia grayii TaxID=363190 RepID=A0ABD1IVX0_9TELE